MSTLTNDKKPKTIREHLASPDFRSRLAQCLPSHVTPERMAAVALHAITRAPKLAQCEQASFFQALLSLSQWGLEPDGRRAHLIPFENRKRGCIEVQLIIDYKGYVELMYRTGLISNIHADVVCENDEFEYDLGEVRKHRIDLKKPRGDVYAAYAIVTMKDGTKKADVMSRDDIEAIRRRSKAANSGPWVTDWNEMAKKTVFRRVSKWVPQSAELRDAMAKDDEQFDYVDGEVLARRTISDITEMLEAPDGIESSGPATDEPVTADSDKVVDATATTLPARWQDKINHATADTIVTLFNEFSAKCRDPEMFDALKELTDKRRKELGLEVQE